MRPPPTEIADPSTVGSNGEKQRVEPHPTTQNPDDGATPTGGTNLHCMRLIDVEDQVANTIGQVVEGLMWK